MHDVVVNASPRQYLHQIGHLGLLQGLAGRIVVPGPVVRELAVGIQHGFDVPDPEQLPWVQIREPREATGSDGGRTQWRSTTRLGVRVSSME